MMRNKKFITALVACCCLPLVLSAHADWWRDTVFYQIFVRSFQDASNGPLAGDGIGDFHGLLERMDYLNDGNPDSGKDLGITGLWLLPIHPSPSYHGYDVTDYFGVHPDYGDMDTFRTFVRAAQARGIRVIIDLVLNHASREHPWFVEALADENSPKRDYFVFADERLHAVGPWGEPAWHYAEGEFYYGVFWSGMPDWNFNHPGVTEFHRRVARFWLEEVGVDGFRLDAVRYLFEDGPVLQDLPQTRRWLSEFRAYCQSIRPDVFIVGEVWADTGTVSQYVIEGSMDAGFEFDLSSALIESVRFSSVPVLQQRLERIRETLQGRPWAAFLTNHDQERVMSQLDGDRRRARMAASMLLLGEGFPFIYYGEEIGMVGRKPDPDLRTPMQWSDAPHAGFTTGTPWRTVNPDFDTINVAAQLQDPDSLLRHYQNLIQIRMQSKALRRGIHQPIQINGRGVYAEWRKIDGESVLIIANFRDMPVRRWSLSSPAPFPNDATYTELLHGAPVSPPTDDPDGWRPLEVLEPLSTYLIRFR